MPLGPQKWQQHRAFYDNLTLADHGDDREQHGAHTYQMHVRFSNYEHFWRHFVAPATQRPVDVSTFRMETAEEVIFLTQRNYTVFLYLLDAYEDRDKVLAGDLGPSFRNWRNCIRYAGDALQVFSELQRAIEENLAAKLGDEIKLFPDWKQKWNPDRESVINFRNYLVHQGQLQVFERRDGDAVVPYTLDRSQITRDGLTWIKTDADFQKNPEQFRPLNDAAREIVTETTDWLNKAYGRIVEKLQGLPETATLQKLWGWQNGQSPVPVAVAGALASQVAPQAGRQTMTGIPPSSDAHVISDAQIIQDRSETQVVPTNIKSCATTCPPSNLTIQDL